MHYCPYPGLSGTFSRKGRKTETFYHIHNWNSVVPLIANTFCACWDLATSLNLLQLILCHPFWSAALIWDSSVNYLEIIELVSKLIISLFSKRQPWKVSAKVEECGIVWGIAAGWSTGNPAKTLLSWHCLGLLRVRTCQLKPSIMLM